MSKLFLRSALILCIGSWSVSAAFAQQVSLTMNDGRVTLKAQNATVRQILDEWARVGGTKVVNAEKIANQPVTLTLIDEPEGRALDTILRSTAGYLVSERTNPTPAGSRFERIMVMARSTAVTTTASAGTSNQNRFTAGGPTPPGGVFSPEGPVNADEDEPPQPMAPVVNPYAPAAAVSSTGGPGAVSGTTNVNAGIPMGTGVGQQQQPAVTPNPGYSNVYGQPGVPGSVPTTTGGAGAATNPPEKFDYANPQKYFQQRQQQGNPMQPYPGVPLSSNASGTGTATSSTGAQTPASTGVPGTGAAGTVTPTVPPGTPSNLNPYSPNFNPYNLPAGQGVPGATGTTPPPTPVEPDRAKYANPYVQPGTQPPPQQQ
jgi:hypothetical protein